mmetsp:Transcript_17792/g.31588  ORF Transcript_17792/g.31588 Transcript_17792/m.31588 type:complete len:138 (-) Transcript_17792:536-949(-)
MTPSEIHAEACELFMKLGLSYCFTCTLMAEGVHPVMRFLFSKPTKEKPIPTITVFADVTYQGRKDDRTILYSVLMEGQSFVQDVEFNVNEEVKGNEFTEAWIDCVYQQKERVRSNFLKLSERVPPDTDHVQSDVTVP